MDIIAYPISVDGHPDASYSKRDMIERVKKAKSGTFLLGNNDWWHGGLHFKSVTDKGKDNRADIKQEYDNNLMIFKPSTDAACSPQKTPVSLFIDKNNLDLNKITALDSLTSKNKQCQDVPKLKTIKFPQEEESFNEAVQAIAKGKIIAYRLNKTWQQQELVQSIKNGIKKTSMESYSTSFVLIEHDLEYEYFKSNNSAKGEIIFKGCKFYSLYMHLVPIDDLLSAKINLPWFLTTERKSLTTPLKRGQDITLVNPSNNKQTNDIDLATINDLTAISHVNLGTIYIPKTMLAKSKMDGKFVMASPLSYYYQPYSASINQLDPSIKFDQVIVPTVPIEVDATEVIGYPGGTIIDNKKVGGLIHFEIFAEHTDFMKNINEQESGAKYAPHYNNSARGYYQWAIHQSFEGFASGQFYLDVSNTSTPNWEYYYNIDCEHDFTKKVYNYSLLNNNLMSDNKTTKPLTICSDADWLEGPNMWQLKPASDYLTDAGQKDQNKPLPTNTGCMAFKIKSEWSSRDLDVKYSVLKQQLTDYSAFIDLVKQHCFWQEVQSQVIGFPKSDEVWHFHPISFIEQLRKIHTPYWDAPNPFKLYRYIDKHSSEALSLLRRREKELNTWLGAAKASDIAPQGSASDALKVAFKTWFGFEEKKAPATLIVDAYSHNKLIPLPAINTLPHAIIWVRDIIQRMIALIETIGISNYVKAYNNFNSCGAYVYADDSRHYVHFANQYLESKSVTDMLKNQSKTSLLNLRIIIHEFSHFYDIGKMIDTKGTLLDKGLYDLTILYEDNGKRYNATPYGVYDCQTIAEKAPSAALCNADNFSFFINYDKNPYHTYEHDQYDYF